MNKNSIMYILKDRGSDQIELSKILGCTYTTVNRKLSPTNKGSDLTCTDMNKMAEFYHMSDKEILKAFFNRE